MTRIDETATYHPAATAKQRLLVFFAHPDDEVFSCGGIFAQNKLRGIHNTLVCATKGEAGEISSPELADASNLGLVREQELIDASRLMGVDDLYFLGYRDSGMAGTEENKNPAAYTNADASAVVPRLVRFIRDVRPQVVLTFDPTGGYGHPDHIAIHKHTVAAFHAAADPAYAPDLGEAWQALRLYYPVFRREMFEALRDQLISQGIEPPDWGNGNDNNNNNNAENDENGENGENGTGEESNESRITFVEQPVHAGVDISEVAPTKWIAFKSHRTQFGPQHPFLQVPEDFVIKMLGTEWFELAWPESKPAQPYTDLFYGLDE